MPQLDPTWFVSQLFWLVLTFATLFFLLKSRVLPSVQNILAGRQQVVSSDLTRAQSLKSEADQARQDYERALADARMRAQQIMDDVALEHKNQSDALSKQMDVQIAQKLAEADKKIAAKKYELMESLTPTAVDISAMIVEKLTQRTPAADRIARVVNDLTRQK